MKLLKQPYRHYHRLADVSFWISAVWLCWFIVSTIAPDLPKMPGPIRTVLRIAFNINILLAIFIVTARFMRDEYAERIWQETASRFVNIMMIGPLILTIAIALNTKRISAALPDILHPRLLEILASENEPAVVFFGGIAATSLVFSIFTPQLFVILHKWHRWRALR